MTTGFEASSRHEVTPWQARYAFPTQSTKVFKQTIKLPAKGGQIYGVNDQSQRSTVMRFEFPADSYANMLNSYLQFELQAYSPTDDAKLITSAGGAANIRGSATATPQLLYIAKPAVALNSYQYWFFRIVSGRYAGFCARIESNSITTPGGGVPDGFFSITLEQTGSLIPPIFSGTDSSLEATARFELVPGIRLQEGGVHNLFNQIRVRYGSMVIEDIRDYSTLARVLMNIGVESAYGKSIGNVLEGMAPTLDGSTYSMRRQLDGTTETNYFNEVRSEFTGIDALSDTMGKHISTWAEQPKTFIMNPFAGLCALKKLLPLKWMAAQITLEFYFNEAAKVFLTGGSNDVQYKLTNPNYVTELLEFDSTYDASFFAELPMGIPLKFDTFNHYDHQITGSVVSFPIPERSRSVKFILGVVSDTKLSLYRDSEKHYHALGEYINPETDALTETGSNPISDYQFRFGGRYSPAQPVNCANGGAEAFAELLKVIDYLGDYGKSNKINQYNWTSHHFEGGSKFIMAISCENNDVSPDTISGMNAEEQNDIALMFKAANSSRPGTLEAAALTKKCHAFVCVDSLLIVKSGNNVQLVK